jgi:cytochrome c oxidase subunit 2
VASFGSGMSLISAFLFIVIVLEMFYSKRTFGRAWFTLGPGYVSDLGPDCVSDLGRRPYRASGLNGDVDRDAPLPYQLGFQDPATTGMGGIVDLHHEIMFYIVLIVTLVFWLLVRVIVLYNAPEGVEPAGYVTHSASLEWAWTMGPAIVLCGIAGPSFALLYSLEEISRHEVTINVTGHQWYWSYEMPLYRPKAAKLGVCFDAVLLQEEDLTEGRLRLLETQERVVFPARTHIRLLITSADVLHS